MAIDVCVTYFGNTYSLKYLSNLEEAIGKNYSDDFNFIVKTDCPYRHWDKISFFQTDKERIIMDIDMLVVGNLDSLFNVKLTNSLAAFQRWWSPFFHSINGGFYKIRPSRQGELLYDKFYNNPEGIITKYGKRMGQYWKGEQTFVNDNYGNIQFLPNHMLGVYADNIIHNGKILQQDIFNNIYNVMFDRTLVDDDHECFGKDVKLVHFLYDDNFIEDQKSWIQELWNQPRSYV